MNLVIHFFSSSFKLMAGPIQCQRLFNLAILGWICIVNTHLQGSDFRCKNFHEGSHVHVVYLWNTFYFCISNALAHRICRTRLRRSRGENHLNRLWVQNPAFVSRYQVWVGLKYFLCSKAIKIILGLGRMRVFLGPRYMNDEIKYDQIKTTQVENDFSTFKGGLK